MRQFSILFLIISLFETLHQLRGKQQDRFFYDAVRAEANGDISSAINFYESASNHAHSANLHGNLANLYFKMEDYGRSILHYRKALLLKPSNRQFTENLNFAYEVAGINAKNNKVSIYFGPGSFNYWVVLSFLFGWLGIIIFSYGYFSRWRLKKFIQVLVFWSLAECVSLFGLYQSEKNELFLQSEVIALLPDESDENQSKKEICLRKFAGAGSSVNTQVNPGESLFLSVDEDNSIRSHKSKDGITWYLANTRDSRKKGWLAESEIGWVLENKYTD